MPIPTYIESLFTAFNEQLAILHRTATTAQDLQRSCGAKTVGRNHLIYSTL
jgi:hypothetical protein